MAEPRDYYVSLDMLTQEYRAALHNLLSERLPPEVYLRRVEQLKAEYGQQRTLEMKAIREQREAENLTQQK